MLVSMVFSNDGCDARPRNDGDDPQPMMHFDQCSLLQLLDFSLIASGGSFSPATNNERFKTLVGVTIPAGILTDTFFFEYGEFVVLAIVSYRTAQYKAYSGFNFEGWSISFLVMSSAGGRDVNFHYNPGAFHSVNSTWTLDGLPLEPPHYDSTTYAPAVRVEAEYHYEDCVVKQADSSYALGDFYSPENCGKRTPLIKITTKDRVVLRQYTWDDYHLSVDFSDDDLPGVYLKPPPGWVIRDSELVPQRIPPEIATNTSLPQPAQPTPVGQSLHLLAALRTEDPSLEPTSRITWSELHEFAATSYPKPRTFDNPSGVDPAVWAACGANGAWSEAAGACVDRTSTARRFDADVQTITARWRSLPSQAVQQLVAAGCAPTDLACLGKAVRASEDSAQTFLQPLQSALAADLSSTPSGQVDQFTSSMYGLRHVLFAVTAERTIDIFHVQHLPEGCRPPGSDPMSPHQVDVRYVNELSLLGPARTIFVSTNAQFLFAAVLRQRWTLATQERLTRVCELLHEDPNAHPALADFRDACDNPSPSQRPRLPAIPDFLQVASACIPGMFCSSFVEERVAKVDDGWHSEFFFRKDRCPEGSFCAQGVRQDCPIGFRCTGSGLPRPIQCDHDATGNLNCYGSGLKEYQLCPNGTLCGVPYLPALPAPPGQLVVYNPAVQRAPYQPPGAPLMQRALAPCDVGWYCNLGRSIEEGDALRCPALTACATPDVVEPQPCDMGGLCNASNCVGEMPYCPAGTSVERRCPAGHYCLRPDQKKPCSAGAYCPPGSPLWRVCPSRYYCNADGSERTPCPVGNYCPNGSIAPTSCNLLSDCDCTPEYVGCESPGNYMAIPILVAIPVVFYLSWRCFKKNVVNKRRARRDAHLAAVRVHKQKQSQASLDVAAAVDGPAVEMRGSTAGPLETRLLGDTEDIEDMEGMSQKEFQINISFKDLGLQLKTGRKDKVMQGVTGQLRAGRVTAVMGPSGAGKSTFVTTVAGKSYYGTTLGELRVNGEVKSLATYNRLMGFVPQEDIMMRDLTVEENLMYSAMTRLPTTWSYERKLRFVDDTIGLLGLREIKDKKIGDENRRGISGGQRKRVNIGMEMVADPTVLFLDEPTSGLDSTSSMEVCGALRRIADLGITVVTVIHQPRYEIFTSFHDVCLLAKGGKLVYLGPSENALHYFESIGLVCPPRVNPPDFFMDAIAGDVPADFRAAHPEWTPAMLVSHWAENRERIDAEAGVPPVPAAAPPSRAELEALARDSAGLPQLTYLALKRSLTQHSRAKRNIATDVALVFIAALSLSAVYYGTPMYEPPQPSEAFATCPSAVRKPCQLCLSVVTDQILNRGSMTAIAIGLTGVASMIRVFGSERVVYFREASGLPQPRHTAAYFIGKDIGMLFEMFLAPFVYTIVYYTIITPKATFLTYYWVLLGLYYTSTGWAYVVSVVAPPALSQLVGVVAVFGNAMFAGGMPVLKELYTKMFPLNVLPYVSYTRYALEALYVGEVREYEQIDLLQGITLSKHLKETFGYDIDAYGRDVAILFGMGVVLRLVAFLVMWLKDRSKKL